MATHPFVSKAVSGVGYLIGLQVLSRALSFLLNVLVVRHLAPAEYGVAALQMHLFMTLVLLVSREAFRKAFARVTICPNGMPSASLSSSSSRSLPADGDEESGSGDKLHVQVCHVMNQMWLVLPLGILAAIASVALFLVTASEEELGLDDGAFRNIILLCACGAIAELVGEPWRQVMTCRLLFRQRVFLEGISLFGKTLLTYILLVWTSVRFSMAGVLSFGYAQIAFGASLSAFYFVFLARETCTPSVGGDEGNSSAIGAVWQLFPHPPWWGSMAVPAAVDGSFKEDASSRGKPSPPVAASMEGEEGDDDGDVSEEDEGEGGGSGNEGAAAADARRKVQRHPRGGRRWRWVDWRMMRLVGSFSWWSWEVLLLQEGEKIVLKVTETLDHQGVFAVVQNLGSLVCRFLFQPLEEMSFTLFSKLLGACAVASTFSAGLPPDFGVSILPDRHGLDVGRKGRHNGVKVDGTKDDGTEDEEDDGIEGDQNDKDNGGDDVDDGEDEGGDGEKERAVGGGAKGTKTVTVVMTAKEAEETGERLAACADILSLMLKGLVILGLVFVCFGPNYSALLLELLYGGCDTCYGNRAVGTAAILGWYCLYVLCMAVNGVTESFVHAVAQPRDLKLYNYLLVFFSVLYMGASYFFIHWWGTPGIIIANCFNMLLRICFSSVFIRRFWRSSNRWTASARSAFLLAMEGRKKSVLPVHEEVRQQKEGAAKKGVAASGKAEKASEQDEEDVSAADAHDKEAALPAVLLRSYSPLASALPDWRVLSWLVLTYFVTAAAEAQWAADSPPVNWQGRGYHVIVGCCCLGVLGVLIRIFDPSLMQQFRQTLASR